MIVSFVVGLFFFGSPTNVAGFVMPVVVDSFDGVLDRGWLSYMLGKSNEGFPPLLTHFDSPTAIERVGLNVLIVTPIANTAPSSEKFCASLAVGFIDSGKSPSPATAAFGHAFPKVASSDDGFISAFATTKPHGSGHFNSMNYSKPMKCLSGKIDECRHSLLLCGYIGVYTMLRLFVNGIYTGITLTVA